MRLNPYLPSWFHLAFFMDSYNRGDYEQALGSALKFNYPELFWDPLMRAAALARLDRQDEASAAIAELRKLVPDIATVCPKLIRGYVRVDDLVEDLVEGLRDAGLNQGPN